MCVCVYTHDAGWVIQPTEKTTPIPTPPHFSSSFFFISIISKTRAQCNTLQNPRSFLESYPLGKTHFDRRLLSINGHGRFCVLPLNFKLGMNCTPTDWLSPVQACPHQRWKTKQNLQQPIKVHGTSAQGCVSCVCVGFQGGRRGLEPFGQRRTVAKLCLLRWSKGWESLLGDDDDFLFFFTVKLLYTYCVWILLWSSRMFAAV